MSAWKLDLFIDAVHDFERSQYWILSNLQAVRRDFSNNRIYPHLRELIALYGTLDVILESEENLRNQIPGQIKSVDLEAQEAIYEMYELEDDQMQAVGDLMSWAKPHIKSMIDEGKTIFEFVEDHLHMEEVGVVSPYIQEGYLLVPDHEIDVLHVLQYTNSVFRSAEERFRSLRTSFVRSIGTGVLQTPEEIKLSLVREQKDFANPATFYFDSEIDFPYESTLLPVAKRKLMHYLAQKGGVA